MITLLLVTRDERWRTRITAAVPDASVFLAAGDAEALGQLGRIDIDVVVWANNSSPAGAQVFLDRVRELVPTCVTVTVGADEDDERPGDFVLTEACSPRQLESVMSQAIDRHRLLRENATLRAQVPAAPLSTAFAAWARGCAQGT